MVTTYEKDHIALRKLSKSTEITNNHESQTKMDKSQSKTQQSAPQKLYNGPTDQATKRKILRQHLFSGRLFSLASIYEGKPLPLFEKSTHLFNQSIDFHGKKFTIKLSNDDPWTDAYTTKLKRFNDYQKPQSYQSLTGTLVGTVLGGMGFTTSILKTAVGGFTKSLFAQMTSSMCAIGILLKTDDTFCCIQAMTILITNLGASLDIFSRIAWPLVTGGMVFQANTPFSWVPSAVAVLLAIIMGATNAGQLLGIFTKSAALGYTMSTIVGTSRIISEAVKELVPFVYKQATGRDWLGETVLSNFESYQDFIQQVDEFEIRKAADIEVNLNYQQEVFDMNAKYKALLEESDRMKLRTTLQPLLAVYARKLAEWTRLVASSGLLLSGARPEPLCILLSGEPGIGKSYVVQQLVKDIGVEHIPYKNTPGETITNHIYQRNVAVAHWDGYHQQFCTLYDDFLQLSDSAAKPNPEVMEMINVAGCNAYHLPMAELSEKKKAFFRSPMVVATTNLKRISSTTVKSIISPDALARRWDLHAEVRKTPTGEYRFHMKLDGEDADVLTYDVFVQLARGKLQKKTEDFQERLRRASTKESEVGNVCLARLIKLASGPANVENTAMRRTRYDSNNLDHSYCHKSLPCRNQQEHQGFWDWWRGSETHDGIEYFHRNLTFGQMLWDPRIITYATVPAETRQKIQTCKAELVAILSESELMIQDPVDVVTRVPEHDIEYSTALDYYQSEAFPSYGLRVGNATSLMHYLYDYHRDLLMTIIPVTVTQARSNIIDTCIVDIDFDLAAEDLISPQKRVELYAGILWDYTSRAFSYITGPLGNLAATIGSTILEYPFLSGLAITVCWTYFVQFASGLVNYMFTNEVEITEAEEAMITTYLGRKNKDKEVDRFDFESRDERGAQKTHRATRQGFESRDEKGNQTSHRAQRMKFENYCEENFDLLAMETIRSFGATYKYITINSKIIDGLLAAEDERYADLYKEAIHQYANLVVLTTRKQPKLSLSALQGAITKMYTALRDAGVKTHQIAESANVSPDLVEALRKLEGTKAESQLFEAAMEDIQVPTETRQRFQGSADQNADGISKKITYNLCDIGPEGSTPISQVFFYSGRRCWINVHALTLLRQRGAITLTRHSRAQTTNSTTYQWKDLTVIEHPKLDIALIQFPITLSPFPDCRELIARDADMNFIHLPAGRLVTRRAGEVCFINSPRVKRLDQAYPTPDGEQAAFTGLGYEHMHTQFGDCGAPFIAIDPTRSKKIMGFHMMGNAEGTGTSVICTMEIINDLETAGKFEPELVTRMQDYQDKPTYSAVLDPVAVIPTPFEPTKTKVRRSVIHGDVSAPTTTPSILRATPELDPMERGLRGMQNQRPNIPNAFIEEAQEVLTLYTSGVPQDVRILTIEEACSGQGVEGLDPIERSTSAGLPLCLESGANGKKKWITEDHQPTQELRRIVEKLEYQIFEGLLDEPPVFKATLKDERVKKKKADLNKPEDVKTRLFAASPLALLIVLRKYYGAFFAHVVRNRVKNSCTTGCNPMGADWQMMADYLHEVSTEVDDGDYSCYDITQPSGFLAATFYAIMRWYKLNLPQTHITQTFGTWNIEGRQTIGVITLTRPIEEIQKKIMTLVIHAHVAAHGTVFRMEGSLPSGVFGTTQINSGVNLVAFFFAFKRLYPMNSAQDFLKNVRTLTHGDDVIFSVSEEFAGFTSERIGLALAEAGMTFTPALKGDTPTQARPIEEVTFLKRGFKKIGGIYRAPLETAASLEMCNWITKTPDPIQATADNISAAMRELAISEPNNDLQIKLQTAFYKRTSIFLPIVRQEDLLAEYTKHF